MSRTQLIETRDAAVNGDGDHRIRAFCTPDGPDVFHAVAYRSDIWKEDPFDVETIHDEARHAFHRLVHRAINASKPSAGRILLLKGEAGSGKTHLMRTIRNWTHRQAIGYCGYMQMTSATDHYGRYVLNNLIDSLDQPYFHPTSESTGLARLSTALIDSLGDRHQGVRERLHEEDLNPEGLADLISDMADQVIMDDRFNNIDLDVIRALLYLHARTTGSRAG